MHVGGENAAFQTDVLTGTLAALDGRRKVTPPPGWADVQPVFLASEDERVVSLARRLGVLFGDGAALGELRAVVVDREAPADRRIAAVESLAEAGDAAVLPDLLDILKQNRLPDRAVMPAAARALAAYESPEAAELLVSRLEAFQNQTRDAALATLVSRPNYARALDGGPAGPPRYGVVVARSRPGAAGVRGPGDRPRAGRGVGHHPLHPRRKARPN